MGQRKSDDGFTLIELLVVISIIATLASIIFPTFSKAREKAREVVCASNLSQIGKALMMYEQDHDGVFPVYGLTDTSTDPPTWLPWRFGCVVYALQPYCKDTRIFLCPTFPEKGPLPTGDYATDAEMPSDPIQVLRVDEGNRVVEYRSDYCLNLGMHNGGRYCSGKAIDMVAEYGTNCAIMADYPSAPTPSSSRHTGGIVLLFVDGHVKRYPFEIARPSAMRDPTAPVDESRDWFNWGWDATRGTYDEWPDIP